MHPVATMLRTIRWVGWVSVAFMAACSSQGEVVPDAAVCATAPTDHPSCPVGGHTSLCPPPQEWIPSCADGHCYECQDSGWTLTVVDCICPADGGVDAN